MQITRHIVLPEPVEPLPEGAASSFQASMDKMQRDLWAMFGNERAVPNVRVCGCRGVVHTCNTIT